MALKSFKKSVHITVYKKKSIYKRRTTFPRLCQTPDILFRSFRFICLWFLFPLFLLQRLEMKRIIDQIIVFIQVNFLCLILLYNILLVPYRYILTSSFLLIHCKGEDNILPSVTPTWRLHTNTALTTFSRDKGGKLQCVMLTYPSVGLIPRKVKWYIHTSEQNL